MTEKIATTYKTILDFIGDTPLVHLPVLSKESGATILGKCEFMNPCASVKDRTALALIEDGMPVIVLAPKDRFFEKTISNMQEVIARGGKVIMITDDTSETMNENIRFKFQIPKTNSTINSFLLTIPIQFLAYHVALLKNCDIDKPRNLAKSVTVE